MVAAQGGRNDVVKILLESGANPNAERIDTGSTSLNLAAEGFLTSG